MKRHILALPGLLLVCFVACSSASSGSGFMTPGGAGAAGAGGAGGAPGGGGSGGAGGSGGSGGFNLGGNDSGMGGGCPYHDSVDHDGDGWSAMSGDCNDCDPSINPGAFDIPMDGIDEDCNGTPDDEPTGCDASVSLASTDPMDGARAIDICRQTTEGATGPMRTWGVVNAQYVKPDGTTTSNPNFDLGFGLLTGFGVNNVQQGTHLLALSSGSARQPTDPGWHNVNGFDKGYTSGSPPPYPKDTPACPGVITGKPHDGAALELTIRVPTNAKAFSFNLNFFTFEFPDYICSQYNDSFVVMMTPKVASLPDDNIAFDSAGNPISVNNSLLQVCKAQTAGGKTFSCPLGPSSLKSTGFDELGDTGPHAATGWLTTTAPVDTIRGKDMTLLFAIWDSGDGILDSTTLVDNFTWQFIPAMGVTTMPTPAPK